MTKGTPEALKGKTSKAKKPKAKFSPQKSARPANPVVAMDVEFRRHPTTGTLDLRLAVVEVLKPHSLLITNPDIEMPDGSTRLCEFYNISQAQEGRFVGREFRSGLAVGSAFIIRDVPRRPAAFKNSVLRYINSCCVVTEEPEPERRSAKPTKVDRQKGGEVQVLSKRIDRLEVEIAQLKSELKAVRKRLPKGNS